MIRVFRESLYSLLKLLHLLHSRIKHTLLSCHKEWLVPSSSWNSIDSQINNRVLQCLIILIILFDELNKKISNKLLQQRNKQIDTLVFHDFLDPIKISPNFAFSFFIIISKKCVKWTFVNDNIKVLVSKRGQIKHINLKITHSLSILTSFTHWLNYFFFVIDICDVVIPTNVVHVFT